jgi:photosystem II stability/assembly factor-like uncharacterized protein
VFLADPPHPPGQLLVSHDGGRSFVRLAAPVLDGPACALTASSSAVLWAQCTTGMDVALFRSADGGRHFAPIAPSFALSGTGNVTFAPLSASTAFLYPGGSLSSVFLTTDGGARFTRLGSLPFDNGGVATFVFFGTREALALGEPRPLGGREETAPDVLERTADGGRSWSPRPY